MIEAALFAYLTADPLIASLIATRVFPGAAPDSAQKPFAVYQKISAKRSLAHDGAASLHTVRIQIDCYAKSHDGVIAIAKAVIDRLHGKEWSIGSIAVQVSQLENEAYSYLPESQLHRVDTDFVIYYGVI